MNYRWRTWFFHHHRWLVPSLGVLAAICLHFCFDNLPGNILAICTIMLGVVYFIQKQKAEDIQIFERLFSKFNERYSALHSEIIKFLELKSDGPSGVDESQETLNKYFNLCAEEYLFFREGRILPDVWQAWCRGMQAYLKNERVRMYWESEKASGSHYGLTIEVIEAGAGRVNF